MVDINLDRSPILKHNFPMIKMKSKGKPPHKVSTRMCGGMIAMKYIGHICDYWEYHWKCRAHLFRNHEIFGKENSNASGLQHLHLNKSCLNKQNPPKSYKFVACIEEKVQRFWLIYCLYWCVCITSHLLTFAMYFSIYLYLYLFSLFSLDKPITPHFGGQKKSDSIFAKQSTKSRHQPNTHKRWRNW